MALLPYENKIYKVIRKLSSGEKTYFYTIDYENDNEVVFFYTSKKLIEKITEREYPILMNMFSIN